jgi:hypothetical protein
MANASKAVREGLEFDRIIPVTECSGGTEPNVQSVCESL